MTGTSKQIADANSIIEKIENVMETIKTTEKNNPLLPQAIELFGTVLKNIKAEENAKVIIDDFNIMTFGDNLRDNVVSLSAALKIAKYHGRDYRRK